MVTKVLLDCRVTPGMFPDERAISFKTAEGDKVELFAPTALVKQEALEVTLLDEQQNLALIRLPIIPTTGTAVVVVNKEQIKKPVSA